MLIYYIIFIISFILTFLDYINDKYFKLLVFIAFGTVLILLPGLRNIGVDNDSSNYNEIFNMSDNYSYNDILTGNYDTNIEQGYLLVNKLIYDSQGTIYTVFFIVAILTGILNYLFIYKLSPFPFTSLLFYLSFFYLYRDFTQIRYGLSCAIVFWAVYFFLRKSWLLFGLSFIASILFHNTAIIMLLIFPICFFIKNKYAYFIFFLISLIGLVVNPFPLILSLVGMPEHMLMYLDAEDGGGFMVSIVGCLVVFFFIIYQNYLNKYSDLDFFFKIFLIGVALSLLFMQVSIFQRFSYLLFQFGVILLPSMFFQLQKLKDRYYFVAFHTCFNFFLLYYGIKLIQPALIRPYF